VNADGTVYKEGEEKKLEESDDMPSLERFDGTKWVVDTPLKVTTIE
jgi:hypothetical protein